MDPAFKRFTVIKKRLACIHVVVILQVLYSNIHTLKILQQKRVRSNKFYFLITLTDKIQIHLHHKSSPGLFSTFMFFSYQFCLSTLIFCPWMSQILVCYRMLNYAFSLLCSMDASPPSLLSLDCLSPTHSSRTITCISIPGQNQNFGYMYIKSKNIYTFLII